MLSAWVLALVASIATPAESQNQSSSVPELAAGVLPDDLVIDGRLDEPIWRQVQAIDEFTQTEPVEGAQPTARTIVRVIAGRRALVIGIVCEDDPKGII